MCFPAGRSWSPAPAAAWAGRRRLAAAREGGSLLLLGRDRGRLDAVAAEIRDIAPDRPAVVIAVDAADAAALDAALAPHAGAIDIAPSTRSASTSPRRAFAELTPDSWAGMVDANLTAAFNLTRAVVPGMRDRGQGLIIHIASVAARQADRSGAAYQATKAGGDGPVPCGDGGGARQRPAPDRDPARHDRHAAARQAPRCRVPAEARRKALRPEDVAAACLFVMALPPRAHVAEIMLQPSRS